MIEGQTSGCYNSTKWYIQILLIFVKIYKHCKDCAKLPVHLLLCLGLVGRGGSEVVSCPTRWSLYWPLTLCIDHPINRETGTARLQKRPRTVYLALITSTVPKWFSQGQKLQNISQNAYSQSNYANFFGCIWETRHSKLCFHKSTEYFSANRSLTAGHFSLQISPILRRNPHRRVQLGVICLALTVKHEVSKSISWVGGGTKMSNSPPILPLLVLAQPQSSSSSALKINHRICVIL